MVFQEIETSFRIRSYDCHSNLIFSLESEFSGTHEGQSVAIGASRIYFNKLLGLKAKRCDVNEVDGIRPTGAGLQLSVCTQFGPKRHRRRVVNLGPNLISFQTVITPSIGSEIGILRLLEEIGEELSSIFHHRTAGFNRVGLNSFDLHLFYFWKRFFQNQRDFGCLDRQVDRTHLCLECCASCQEGTC